jgi:spore germination protein YaaH
MSAAVVMTACTPPVISGAPPTGARSDGDLSHPLVMQQTGNGDSTAGGTIQPLFGAGGLNSTAPVGPIFDARTMSLTARPKREVFGFAFGNASLADPTYGYPAWNMGLLSTVAYFGLSINSDGTIIQSGSGWTTWNSSQLTGLVSTAHANGVKVIVSVNLHDFSSSPGSSICAALYPTRRATTVSQIAAQVSKMGVDGVNLDYEGSNTTCQYRYTLQSAMISLAAEFRAKLPRAYIAIDTYSGSAGDSTGFFNIPKLAPYVDSFFVMAYDMEYSNFDRPPVSCTSFCIGPTAPLTAYHYNDTSSMTQYTAVVPASKVILGVPYYGRKECVAGVTPTTAPPNAKAVSGSVAADGYLDASTENGYSLNSDYQMHREVHDVAGYERWDTWTSSSAKCTREMYWDDVASLGRKYDLVNQDGLRGVGIFALQYGGGAPELWQLLQTKFMGCTGAQVSSFPSSPQPPGAVIQFTATATGCSRPLYEFWLQYPNGTYVLKQSWGAGAWTWNSKGAPVGNYLIDVWANQTGDPNKTWQSYGGLTFTLALLPHCATATPSPLSATQAVGTSVSFTAASSGCGTPTYEYWVQDPRGSWTMRRPFSMDPTWTWSSSGLVPGIYTISVWANQYGDSTAAWETYGFSRITLTGCASAALNPSQLAITPGPVVTFTATSAGCDPPLYKFWVMYPNGTWYPKQDWGGATFNWATAGLPNGTYTIHDWANQQGGSMSSWQAYGSATVSLVRCTSASLTPKTGSVAVGASVTFTAASTGCPVPVYEFWLQDQHGAWRQVVPFGLGKTWQWDTTGWGKGTFTVHVWANQQGSNYATWQAYGEAKFTLT